MTFDTGENLQARWYVMRSVGDEKGETVTKYDGPTTIDRASNIKRAYVEQRWDYLFLRSEKDYIDMEHTLGVYILWEQSVIFERADDILSSDEDIPF